MDTCDHKLSRKIYRHAYSLVYLHILPYTRRVMYNSDLWNILQLFNGTLSLTIVNVREAD